VYFSIGRGKQSALPRGNGPGIHMTADWMGFRDSGDMAKGKLMPTSVMKAMSRRHNKRLHELSCVSFSVSLT
jgi:hypothetical protein